MPQSDAKCQILKITREADQKLQPGNHAIYFPLINMNPAEQDTILLGGEGEKEAEAPNNLQPVKCALSLF